LLSFLDLGTCVPLCYSAFLLKFLGIKNIKIIFIESFCRVEKLSLTGKLLYPIVDRFLVQWKEHLVKYQRAEYLMDSPSLLSSE
jgi:beta-1,4-N-acetylglucosaminyltransferase